MEKLIRSIPRCTGVVIQQKLDKLYDEVNDLELALDNLDDVKCGAAKQLLHSKVMELKRIVEDTRAIQYVKYEDVMRVWKEYQQSQTSGPNTSAQPVDPFQIRSLIER